tara:strand:- start:47 stop:1108 length:1062 start_codon:yes stop_codon:yes gene_type:complete
MEKKNFYQNKKVIVTGHTGFKGSWLALWLNNLGARVFGVSSNIPTNPSNYSALNLKKIIEQDKRIDIRNGKSLFNYINKINPDLVFHLAAQALVTDSFKDPIKTWETNVNGTLNIIKACNSLKKRCSVVLVTSDKCYYNFETKRGYKENDILGGADPYSSSKASAEYLFKSLKKNYFKKNIRVVTARAGNVIGGGDWSKNRLIPDCIKSWFKNERVIIKNINSTRPWQHVLDALNGYLILGMKNYKEANIAYNSYNFGPDKKINRSVGDILDALKKNWPNFCWEKLDNKKNKIREQKLLNLDSSKAKKILKWKCRLSFKRNIHFLSEWYYCYYKNKRKILDTSIDQIKYYDKF